MPAALRLPLAALLVAAAGCADAPPTAPACVPGVDPACAPPPPAADDVVAGVNLTEAGRPASAAEVAEARARRSGAVTGGAVTRTRLALDADGTEWLLLALERPTETVALALARVPGPAGATARLRTLVVLPDGAGEAGPDALLTEAGFRSLPREAVQVAVAFRGAAVRFRGQTYTPDLPPEPYAADVPDARAFLAAAGGLPRADASRVGAVGLGRGGTVALLAAQRDPRVRAVVSLGAPTDLLAPSFLADARVVLQGGTPPTPFPALDGLVAPLLDVRDGRATLAEARVRLLTLSPRYFAADLPATLALHAAQDDVVAPEQGRLLGGALTGSAGAPRLFQLVPNVTHAGILGAGSVQGAVASFLEEQL